MRAPLIALALVATTATAADRSTPPPATPTGEAATCINRAQIRETRVYGDSTIDFVMGGGRIYRNVLPSSCPGLGFEERFGYETSLGQLCSTDIITVLYQSGPARGASCGLGTFQPMTLDRAPGHGAKR